MNNEEHLRDKIVEYIIELFKKEYGLDTYELLSLLLSNKNKFNDVFVKYCVEHYLFDDLYRLKEVKKDD